MIKKDKELIQEIYRSIITEEDESDQANDADHMTPRVDPVKSNINYGGIGKIASHVEWKHWIKAAIVSLAKERAKSIIEDDYNTDDHGNPVEGIEAMKEYGGWSEIIEGCIEEISESMQYGGVADFHKHISNNFDPEAFKYDFDVEWNKAIFKARGHGDATEF